MHWYSSVAANSTSNILVAIICFMQISWVCGNFFALRYTDRKNDLKSLSSSTVFRRCQIKFIISSAKVAALRFLDDDDELCIEDPVSLSFASSPSSSTISAFIFSKD